MKCFVDDVSLGTETVADHYLLLQLFLSVCKELQLRIKWSKCVLLKDVIEYCGFQLGHGVIKPFADKVRVI